MDKIEDMLGYKPDRETRVALLRASKESGKSLQEVIGSWEVIPVLPYMAIMEDNDCDGEIDERCTGK